MTALLIRAGRLLDGTGGPARLDHDVLVFTDSDTVFLGEPALLVGGGGGKLRPGRYVDAGGMPMSNLFVTMLDHMGVRVDSFGDSNGRFDNI